MPLRNLSGEVEPLNSAIFNDYAGYSGQVFPWLEKAFENRAPRMPYLRMLTFSREIRGDPRFSDILSRMNLPQEEPKWLAQE